MVQLLEYILPPLNSKVQLITSRLLPFLFFGMMHEFHKLNSQGGSHSGISPFLSPHRLIKVVLCEIIFDCISTLQRVSFSFSGHSTHHSASAYPMKLTSKIRIRLCPLA